MTEQTIAEQVAAMHQAANRAADPVMSVFAEEQARLARWIDVHPDYTTTSEVSDILAAVDDDGTAR
jgi:hypothetical protein